MSTTPENERDTTGDIARGVTVALVLAAGSGSRFAGTDHKLSAMIGGRTVAHRAIAAAIESGIGPVVVVTGASAPDVNALDVMVVHNPNWHDGQATSLVCGIDAARLLGADAVVVGLADQPFIEPAAWRLVAAAESPIAIATYDGRRRNPVRLHRSVWALLPRTGDEGARSLARLRSDLVEEVPCPGSPADIDTLADLNHAHTKHAKDLRTWQNESSTNSP